MKKKKEKYLCVKREHKAALKLRKVFVTLRLLIELASLQYKESLQIGKINSPIEKWTKEMMFTEEEIKWAQISPAVREK